MKSETLRLRSNSEWQRWGKSDPLWAVATEPGKRRGEISAWSDDDFYAAGESDWHDFLPHWREFGLDAASCLEIGCGAGRMTKQLALTFEKVVAVDVSEDMIAYAKRKIDKTNIEFCVTDGLVIPKENRSVAAIFSTHVFQHFDSTDVALACFRECFRVLDIEGSIMIHVPIFEWPGGGRIAQILDLTHAALTRLSDVMARAKRRAGVDLMRGTAYRTGFLYASLIDLGFKDVQFRIVAASRNGLLHSFVLARK